MEITLTQLRGLSVVTKSGIVLGSIVDADIDAETRHIFRYHVRSNGLLRRLAGQEELIIADIQVIALTHEHLLVEDTDEEVKETASPLPQHLAENIASSLSTRS